MGMVIHCECGYTVRGGTEDEVVERARVHVAESHPELKDRIKREDFLAMAEEE